MKILITGIAGTWGKEFTKQLKDEHEIVGVDNSEIAVANFKKEFPDVEIHMRDFVDFCFVNKGFDMVLHLAAYKHIDLIEKNIVASVENNVSKTAKLFNNAKRSGVRIVFISTDKTVNPVSVYGMTKRLGELLAWENGGQVVRSGNIIGSNGSVVHAWRAAVENNQPLKVTDMAMVRYFIPVDQAIKASWEGIMAGKKLTIIDIGGKRTLGEIINTILGEYGKDLDNYEPGIEVIGKRPGERLVDEIRWENEDEFEKENSCVN